MIKTQDNLRTFHFSVPGKLPNLNDYTDASKRSRKSWNAGNDMKQSVQEVIRAYIRRAKLSGLMLTRPVYITYVWVEPDKHRDKDNIAFAKKFIQDALVQERVIKNDGWRYIDGFADHFAVDKDYPRVEVEITEVNR